MKENVRFGQGRCVLGNQELTKKKRTIDLHNNIATALLDQINDRGLDGHFQVEEEVLARPGNFDLERILALIRDVRGSPSDKLCLFLIHYLCVDISDELSSRTSALQSCGCTDMRAYKYLQTIPASSINAHEITAASVMFLLSVTGAISTGVDCAVCALSLFAAFHTR